MDRRYKGKIGEQKVILRALEKGWQVSIPVIPARYDLVLDNGKELLRTQVKYSTASPSASNGSIVIDLRRRRHKYSTDEVDLLLVYLPAIDKVLAFQTAIFCGKSAITVRLKPPKNNQVDGILRAEEFIW